MAESKPAEIANKVAADVSVEAKPSTAPMKKPAAAKAPDAKSPAAKKAVARKPVAKPATKPVAAPKKPVPAKKPVAATKTAPKPKPAPAAAKSPAFIPAIPTITELKETIMATDYTADITKTMTSAVAEMQGKIEEAITKSNSVFTEVTEFAKGNVEAVVESGKIYAAGVQDLGKTYAEEAKSAYETATADLKEMAAVKSPTELFQLQGQIMRRNFDAMMAQTTKSTDAAMKLATDTVAPISGRVNVAAEKLSDIAA